VCSLCCLRHVGLTSLLLFYNQQRTPYAYETKRRYSFNAATKTSFDQKFISPRQLAIRWDLSVSAVYHGHADVYLLRRISFGRSVRFLLSEVEAVEAQKIALAS
jgi:predicted DNA-binding transcriptional regulator AlpA